MELALSRGPIPAAFFDAVTSNEAESVELEYQTNKARQSASLRAKCR